MFWIGVAFVFGACAGSFANVCIYRMPMEISIVTPRSKCPHCGTLLTWQENIPLISWLMLGARCKTCCAPISVRYPIIEMLTGAVFSLVVWRVGMVPATPVYLILMWSWIVLSGIDWDYYFIPDEINITGMVAGPVIALIAQFVPWPTGLIVQDLWASLLGLAVGGGVIWFIRKLGSFILRQEAMGFGDVKLMAFIGSFLGWKFALISIFLGAICGTIVGLAIKASLHTKTDPPEDADSEAFLEKNNPLGIPFELENRYTRIPFGPYLVLGSFITFLYGKELWAWYWQGLAGSATF